MNHVTEIKTLRARAYWLAQKERNRQTRLICAHELTIEHRRPKVLDNQGTDIARTDRIVFSGDNFRGKEFNHRYSNILFFGEVLEVSYHTGQILVLYRDTDGGHYNYTFNSWRVTVIFDYDK